MFDRFDRSVNYLRISVTDRCNLRCRYCMPEEGISLMRHEDILSFDEIVEFTKAAVDRGIIKVRLTGGEPLVRKGIVSLVSMISGIDGISDLSMTTNGQLLGIFARDLKKAGLHRVNVSLDAINSGRYSYITRGGNINYVLDGIKSAQDEGLTPVKINCVIRESKNEKDAKEVQEYCHKNNFEIRFIRQMDLVSGQFSVIIGGSGGDCSKCNRLRLTSNGFLMPCLFNDIGINIRTTDYGEAIEKAVKVKPEHGSNNLSGKFYNIGG